MSSSLTFELVTPEKLLFSKPVTMVTVPGGEGDYGVLAGHAPMITTVKTGVIDVYADNEKIISERIFVAGGFAEVNANRCTVLAEEAVPVAQLNRANLEQQLKNLRDASGAAKSDTEHADLQGKIAVVEAKLRLAAA